MLKTISASVLVASFLAGSAIAVGTAAAREAKAPANTTAQVTAGQPAATNSDMSAAKKKKSAKAKAKKPAKDTSS